MRTVLCRTVGRAAFILAAAGMVGSAVLPAVPVLAATAAGQHRPAVRHAGTGDRARTEIGSALKFVREADGSVRRVR